jgi:hypothetical protein
MKSVAKAGLCDMVDTGRMRPPPCVDALRCCYFRRLRARLQGNDLIFYRPTVSAVNIVECKIAATWMSLDGGLHYWLAALGTWIVKVES